MPYKDKHGIWRHDEPTGNNGEEPDFCPNCGDLLDMDRLDEDDDLNESLMNNWEGHQLGDINMDSHFELWAVMSHVCSQAVCEDCELWIPYGPNYYYDIDTNTYTLPAPLTHEESEIAEREAERIAQEAAGQLRLFQ